METNKTAEQLLEESFSLIDAKHGTKFEKSKTAFLTFSLSNGSKNISAFLARAIGLVSGDRIAILQSKTNPLKVLIAKTSQRHKTLEVRIVNGVSKINSKKITDDIGSAFRFNKGKGVIRLYVNISSPVKISSDISDKAYQIFDIPELREDFPSESEKQDYIKYISANPYIIAQK